MTKEEAKDLYSPEAAKFKFDELTRMIIRAQDAGDMTNEEIALEFNCTLDFVHHARSRATKAKRVYEEKQKAKAAV